jgi:hypothetical protein
VLSGSLLWFWTASIGQPRPKKRRERSQTWGPVLDVLRWLGSGVGVGMRKVPVPVTGACPERLGRFHNPVRSLVACRGQIGGC